MAYESDVAGTLTEILAAEGETLPIGTPIARVGDSGEGSSARAAGPVAQVGPSSSQAAGEDPTSTPPAAGAREPAPRAQAEQGGAAAGSPKAEGAGARAGERVKASPVARRIAEETGFRPFAAHRALDLAGGSLRRMWKLRPLPRVTRGRGSPAARRARSVRAPWGMPPRQDPRPRPPRAKFAVQEPTKARSQHDRAADGGVEGDGAALLPDGGDRHDQGGRGAGGDQGRGEARARSCPRSTTWW